MECIASQVKTQSEIKDELVHKIQQLFQKTEQQHALFDQEIGLFYSVIIYMW